MDRITEGERPKSGEIADELGTNSAVLGRLLTKYGFPKPINTTRVAGAERLPGKFYTADLVPEIGGEDVLP